MKLEDIGLSIFVITMNEFTRETSSTGAKVFLHDKRNGLYVSVPMGSLRVFGYVSNGPMIGITGVLRTDNGVEQIQEAVKIMSEALLYRVQDVSHFEIVDYLKKLKPTKKVDKEAIKRTIPFIDYNDIKRQRTNESKYSFGSEHFYSIA